jgi:hypothetical protein
VEGWRGIQDSRSSSQWKGGEGCRIAGVVGKIAGVVGSGSVVYAVAQPKAQVKTCHLSSEASPLPAIRRGRGDWECTAVQRVQAGRAAAERGEREGKRSYAAVCSTSDRLCVYGWHVGSLPYPGLSSRV